MNETFYWFSKLIWLIISPDSLFLIWFGLGILSLSQDKIIRAKRLLMPLFLLLIIVGFLPVGNWLLFPLESRYPHNPELHTVDGIVVLSGSLDPVGTVLWDQPMLGDAAERDFTFLHLAREFPEAKLVYTGGASSMLNQSYKAADAAKKLYQEQGLDLSRLTIERKSRNTWENGLFTKELVVPKAGESWMLITTAWHMPRALGVFCKVGWDVIPYPVDFQTKPGYLLNINWNFSVHLQGLVTAVKAWIGLVAYKLLGMSC